MAKVLTIGTFDIPHIGHAHLMAQAAALGDLTVGVNSDDFVLAYKGVLPHYSAGERMALIEAMGYRTLENDGPGRDLIVSVCPDFLVIGSDWLRRNYRKQIGMKAEELDLLGIALVYVPYTNGISTTDIVNRLGQNCAHYGDAAEKLRAKNETLLHHNRLIDRQNKVLKDEAESLQQQLSACRRLLRLNLDRRQAGANA